MNTQRPEPLVPEYIDLKNFEFMPLDVQRLLGSETWIEAADHPFLGHAMMSLWAASWHEVPAGSLPNKAKVLARHAHCTLERFETIAQAVLAGWVLCSDGRFYHPVVCEKAVEAWEQKQKFKARTAKATAAKIAGAKGNRNGDRDDDRNDDRDEPRNEDEQTLTGPDQEQETPQPPEGELELNPVQKLEAKKIRRRNARKRIGLGGEADFSPVFTAFWEAYPKKVGKQEAWKAWERDQLDEFGATIMRDVAERAKKDDRWLRGFVPDPATYINQRRWTDEIVAPKPQERPQQAGPTHNPAGTSPRKAVTPHTRLEAAESFAAGQVDHNGWTPQQVEDYLKPYREAVRAADKA